MLCKDATGILRFLTRNTAVVLKGTYRRVVSGLPLAFSFNVSDRCPVGCDCYWRRQPRVKEMSDKDVFAFFLRMRRQGYLHVSMVGGEPYVRPNLLKKLAGAIPWSWLVISGTTPLLTGLPNTTHVVSIDGGDSATHDNVRRMQGLYDRILKNVGRARSSGYFPVIIHSTLNAVNYRQVGKIMQTWSNNGLADGIMVSTMTPIRGAKDHDYLLSREQRVWIVDELLGLKKQCGDFLVVSSEQIKRLHPDHTIKMTPSVCGMSTLVDSFDAAGNRINQCILSEKADCKQCGCISSAVSDDSGTSWLKSLSDSVSAIGQTISIG